MEFFVPFSFSICGAEFFFLTGLFFCKKFIFFFEEFLEFLFTVFKSVFGAVEFSFCFFGEFEVG